MPDPERVAAGVVLHADLVGFTPMTQARTAAGPGGVEELHALLDSSFGRMAQAVERHGGCVVAFAGDALTAVFLGGTAGERRRRGRCAATEVLEVTARATDDAAQGPPGAAAVGSFRVGLGEGEVRRLRVGAAELGWHEVVTGSALARAVRAQSGALPGRIATAWSTPDPEPFVALGPSPREPAASGWATTPDTGLPLGAATAEHRIVSTAFVRIGSTQDPGALRDIAPAALRLIADHEGTLRQIDGSGAAFAFVLGFGAPSSTPDDVIASVGCCLRLLRLAEAAGLPATAGVATGEVFCAQLGGAGHREYVVIGDSVNHAARLSARATPGQLLVDTPTAQRCRSRVVIRPAGAPALKGRREEAVFAVVGLRGEVEARAGRVARHVVDEPSRVCVGRDREFTAVLRLLQRGAGGALLLGADAGLGKTRLLDDLAAHLPGVVLRGRAGDIGDRRPYLPWHQVVRTLLEDETPGQESAGRGGATATTPVGAMSADPPPGAMPDDAMPRQTSSVGRLPLADRGFADLLAEAAGLAPTVPASDTAASQSASGPSASGPSASGLGAAATDVVPPGPTLSAEDRAATTRRLVVDLVARRLARGPVTVLLDDAERFDDLSVALTHELIGLTRRLPLVLVLTARERPDWLGADDVRHLELGPLAPAIALRLARHLLGSRHPEVDEVARRSGGNPLFIGQLAAWVTQPSDGSNDESSDDSEAESGLDAPTRRRPGSRGEPRPPSDLRRLVTARVDRLPRPSRTTLQAAAVIGSAQRLPLLRRCVAGLAPDLAVDVDVEVRRLADLGLLTHPDRAAGATFVDPLVREVVYAGLSLVARARLHATVTLAFERDYERALGSGRASGGAGIPVEPEVSGVPVGAPNSEHVTLDMVAFHAARCPDVERQRRWLDAAARAAEARYATRSAIDALDRLLRIEGGPARADLLIRRGTMLALAGRHAEAEADLRAAGRAHAPTPGDDPTDPDATAGRDEPAGAGPLRARADCELGILLLATPRFEEGLALLESAAGRLERMGNLPACLTALDRLAYGRLQHGDTAGAASTARRQFALARATRDPGRRAAAEQNLALLAWHEGRREEAVRLMRRAHADARRGGDRRLLVHTGNDLAGMLAETGHPAEAAERLTEALYAAREIGYRRATAGMIGNLAELHRLAGHPASAASIALTGLWEALDLLDCPAIAQLAVNLALSWADAGHPGAPALLARAAAIAEALDQVDAQTEATVGAPRSAQVSARDDGAVRADGARSGAPPPPAVPRLPRPRGLLRAGSEQIEAAFARAESLVAARVGSGRPTPRASP